MRDQEAARGWCGPAPRPLGLLGVLEFPAAKPEGGCEMTDFLENVALLIALLLTGAGVFTIVMVMFLKFIDTLEDRRND